MEMNGINESVLEMVERIVDTKVLTTLPDWDCFITFGNQIVEGASYRYIELLSDAMNKTPRQLTSLDVSDEKYQQEVIDKMVEEFSIPKNHKDLETAHYSDADKIFHYDFLELIEYLFMSHGIHKAVADIYGTGEAKDKIINREMDLFLEELMNEGHGLKMDNFIVKAMSHINSYSRKMMNRLERHIEEETADEIG
jgi:hypothetical protein